MEIECEIEVEKKCLSILKILINDVSYNLKQFENIPSLYLEDGTEYEYVNNSYAIPDDTLEELVDAIYMSTRLMKKLIIFLNDKDYENMALYIYINIILKLDEKYNSIYNDGWGRSIDSDGWGDEFKFMIDSNGWKY